MRIGIDVRALCWERSGFTRYIRNLLGNLAALDEENEYVLYMNSARKLEEVRGKSNFSVRVIRAPMPAYKYLSVPVCLARDRIDLFHSMTQELPFLSPCRMVTTCYDLNVEFFPGLYRWRVRMLSALRLARASARRADRIIAISESTRNDLVRVYGVSREKIKVIPLGVEESFRPVDGKEARERVKQDHGIDAPFILYVGQIREQKNISRLLDAFRLVRDSGVKHGLVLSGHTMRGSEHYDLQAEVTKRGLARSVTHVSGYQETADLALLYNAADLLVYPSLYEGFGLPILEAMACGTPVVASNTSSMPEVAGEAGVLVDPYDVNGMADAMHSVVADRGLHARLSSRGLEQAGRFSWREAALETLAFYRSVVDA